MPYWLKGGIIFPLTLLVISAILYFSGILSFVALIFGSITGPYILFAFLFPFAAKYGGIMLISNLLIIIFLLIQFMVGCFIGWIYGRIKSINKKGGKTKWHFLKGKENSLHLQ